MQTPWGDIDVLDAHTHFFSPAFFKSLAEQKGAQGGPGDIGEILGWQVPESSEALADRWIEELNRNGVAGAVLIASIPGDAESVGVAVHRHPERFHSVLMVNPLLPGADRQCAGALDRGQIHGIFLFPAMHRFSMRDPCVHSLLSILAGRPGTAIYVHCGVLSVGFRAKLGLLSPFDMRFSNPVDLHAVALLFPALRFVIPHFGAGYFREALMLADACPNVYFDTSSSNRWMRFDTHPINLARVFRAALDVLGPKRLLFGTDSSWFPRGWMRNVFDAQVQALSEAGADEDTARDVFGGNFRRLFREKRSGNR